MEVPISEVAPCPDPGRQYVSWAGGLLQVQDGGGSSGATMTEAGSGVDDARTGLSDADSGRASLAVEAEFGAGLTGSESRADVAPKDESTGIAADWAAGGRRRIKKAGIKSKAQHEGGSVGEFWANVGRSDSDRLQISADQQSMAPKGASEQAGETRTSSQKANKVSYDWISGAKGASPNVDRPEPVAARAQVGMVSWMAQQMTQATQPMGRVMLTSDGDMRLMARRPSRADGVADGGMLWAYKRDRTQPMAEPVMLSWSQETTVTDSNLLGPREGSLALPQVCR